MDAFREHQDDIALRPTDDDQAFSTVSELPDSELDWTVSVATRQTGLLLLSLGTGDLRLDPGQRKQALIPHVQRNICSRLSCAHSLLFMALHR